MFSNSDFVVSWQVDGDRIKSGYLTHCDKGDGYFTVMLLPPRRVGKRDVSPKEMIFFVDCSGSQAGDPLEKVKQTLNYCVDNLNPDDTFQIVCFGNELRVFPERPMVLSANMALEVRRFGAQLEATGGTWMAPAVEKVCSLPPDRHRLRIVSLMTDGFIGNDMEIVDTVKKFRGSSRWFPFGTGSGVNRFLIEAIATEGGGEPEYVDRKDETKAVAKHFFERVSSPVLTDVKVGFQGVEPIDVFPSAVADVWAERPLFIKGCYAKPGTGKVILTGFAGGKPYRQELPGFSSAASWQPIARVGLGSRESRPDNLE